MTTDIVELSLVLSWKRWSQLTFLRKSDNGRIFLSCDPTGSRTPVFGMRTRCPNH